MPAEARGQGRNLSTVTAAPSLPCAEAGVLGEFSQQDPRQQPGLNFQHSPIADLVAENGMRDFLFHASLKRHDDGFAARLGESHGTSTSEET